MTWQRALLGFSVRCTNAPPPPPPKRHTVLAIPPMDALEGKGPPRRPQKRLDRQLEEVAKAVGIGYCQLQMPLKLALAVREGGGGYVSPSSNASLIPPLPAKPQHTVLHCPTHLTSAS